MEKMTVRVGVLMALIGAAAATRFMMIPNFTAVGAMALFAGAYFSNRWMSLFLPLATLFVSDLVLNNVVYATQGSGFVWFHDSFGYVYGAFALSVVLSWRTLQRVTAARVGLTAVASALLFFAITNFAAWKMAPEFYPQNAAGLMMSYVAGLPFLPNSILGNLFFSAVMFGSFEWARRRFVALA